MEYLLNWFEAHPGLASWFQAIGSMLALAIALIVVFFQNNAARQIGIEERHHLECVKLRAILAVLAWVAAMLQVIERNMSTNEGKGRVINQGDIEDRIQALKSFPLHDVPDAKLVIYLNALPGTLSAFEAAWKRIEYNEHLGAAFNDPNIRPFRQIFDQLKTDVNDAINVIQKARILRGDDDKHL